MRFAGQGWLVTGGTSGIGLAVAQAAAAEGATVVVAARSEREGVPFVTIPTDVGDEQAVEALFEALPAHLEQLDVVVNCAGVVHDALLVQTSLKDWQATLNTNLRGPFLVCRSAVEEMLGTGGRIVNVSSFAANGLRGQAAYSAAKSGLVALTRSIAKEYGSRGIACNAVLPGFVDTPMTEAMDARARDLAARMTPTGRLARAAEVADAVLFLASQDAAFVQGDALVVAGGVQEAQHLGA